MRVPYWIAEVNLSMPTKECSDFRSSTRRGKACRCPSSTQPSRRSQREGPRFLQSRRRQRHTRTADCVARLLLQAWTTSCTRSVSGMKKKSRSSGTSSRIVACRTSRMWSNNAGKNRVGVQDLSDSFACFLRLMLLSGIFHPFYFIEIHVEQVTSKIDKTSRNPTLGNREVI